MSTLKTNAILDASGGTTATVNGYTPTASNMAGRNRIINGNMAIDQRNAGAAITVNNNTAKFSCDRWYVQGESTDGVFTVQQSTTAPAGFTQSMLFTVTTVDASIGASQAYFFKQAIEGYNVADLGWGTASAQTVTLSFWVRSSVTGTYGASVLNSAANRSYPFTYTISSANTWEQKTVTIAGDTSGTWAKDNTAGIQIYFNVGMGSTYLGAANAWAGATYLGATGQTNLISTSGATFYITGVQLEKGSTATDFEYRPYGAELALCQRYYETSVDATALVFSGQVTSGSAYYISGVFAVEKRIAPTMTFVAGTAISFPATNPTPSVATTRAYRAGTPAANATTVGLLLYSFTAASEL